MCSISRSSTEIYFLSRLSIKLRHFELRFLNEILDFASVCFREQIEFLTLADLDSLDSKALDKRARKGQRQVCLVKIELLDKLQNVTKVDNNT